MLCDTSSAYGKGGDDAAEESSGVRDNSCCRMTFQYEKVLLTALSLFVFDDVPS